MRIAVADPTPDQMSTDHWAVIEGLADAAAGIGAELLVLPEFALHGPIAPSDAAAVAEPSDGPAATKLRELARSSRLAILAGYAESCTGRVYSSALLVDSDGVAIASYRRSHIMAEEDEHISRGHWLTMMPLGDRRVGIVIGYDLLFPEVLRGLTLSGADLILGLGPRDLATASSSALLLPARAQDNEVPIAWSGWRLDGTVTSAILDPFGVSGSSAGRHGAVDHARVLDADVGPMPRPANLRLDRRPRLYQRLADLDGVDAPGRTV